MKELFPILQTELNNHPLVYLDNAATMQMPLRVMDKVANFYQTSNANIHRGIHSLSESATTQYEEVREKVCKFIGANDSREIIFTSGTTASINMVAQMLESKIDAGDRILITEMEHHSNILPWRELANRKGAYVDVAPIHLDGTLDLNQFKSLLCNKTKIVSFTEVSNVTGLRNPLKEMVEEIRFKTDAWILVDGAQGVVHERSSVKEMGIDFYAFSGHKLGAPTGTGVLYINQEKQNQLRPCNFGGGTVHSVTKDGIQYVDGPSLYEPGTPNYAGIIELGYTIDFWLQQEIDHNPSVIRDKLLSGELNIRYFDLLDELDTIAEKEAKLLSYLELELSHIHEVKVLGYGKKHFGCISFVVDGIHPYDIARMLNDCNIAVRSGHMCAQPYIEALGYSHVVRVSVAPYNTMADIDCLIVCLTQIIGEMKALSVQKTDMEQIWDKGQTSINTIEQMILRDLNLNDDTGKRQILLAKYAAQSITPPNSFRHDVYKMVECQVDAVVFTGWIGDKRSIFVDSSSTMIKGALSILQKLYMGRTRAEISNYNCRILESNFMKETFAHKQLDIMNQIIKAISDID